MAGSSSKRTLTGALTAHLNEILSEEKNRTEKEDTSFPEKNLDTEVYNKIQQSDSTLESNRKNQHTKPTIDLTLPNRLTAPNFIRTVAQKKIYSYLKNQGSHISSYAIIAKETKVKPGTIRDIMRKFEKEGLISKKKWVGENGAQGLMIVLNEKFKNVI